MVQSTKSTDTVRVLDRQDGSSTSEGSQATPEGSSSQNTQASTNQKIEVDIGLDVSTSVIGVCVLEHKTGKMLSIYPVKLNKAALEDLWDKTTAFEKTLKQNTQANWTVKRIFVEDVAKKFSSGFSSAQTIVTLAKMNALACWIAYGVFGVKPTFINVRTARAALGIKIDTKDKTKTTKEKVFEKVLTLQPSFPWLQHTAKTGKHKDALVYDTCNQDMGDAWVACRGGQSTVP